MDYAEIEKKLEYVFKDKSLLKRSLTLPSADPDENNQIMEFFGDAILEFLVSEKIYDENKSEGELTELRKSYVSDAALTPVSERLEFDKHFLKSSHDNVLKKSKPSAYEAVLAAIYLDGGIDAARSFVYRTIDFAPVSPQINYKGKLQELLQGEGKPLPVYYRKQTGTPQNPVFRAAVCVSDMEFVGEAGNVRRAEQLAAQKALSYLENRR